MSGFLTTIFESDAGEASEVDRTDTDADREQRAHEHHQVVDAVLEPHERLVGRLVVVLGTDRQGEVRQAVLHDGVQRGVQHEAVDRPGGEDQRDEHEGDREGEAGEAAAHRLEVAGDAALDADAEGDEQSTGSQGGSQVVLLDLVVQLGAGAGDGVRDVQHHEAQDREQHRDADDLDEVQAGSRTGQRSADDQTEGQVVPGLDDRDGRADGGLVDVGLLLVDQPLDEHADRGEDAGDDQAAADEPQEAGQVGPTAEERGDGECLGDDDRAATDRQRRVALDEHLVVVIVRRGQLVDQAPQRDQEERVQRDLEQTEAEVGQCFEYGVHDVPHLPIRMMCGQNLLRLPVTGCES